LNLANLDIRKEISESKLRQWMIAEELKVSEFTFCKWLRRELTIDKKQEIINAINSLKKKLKL
jgi:hypothetical protein